MSMTKTPEQKARKTIDKMLDESGWDVQDVDKANIHAKKVWPSGSSL
jgi:type I site-specific restriction endonuclease